MNKVEIIRKYAVYAVYIIFLTSFQVSFPDKLTFNGQIADLMFVFVVLVLLWSFNCCTVCLVVILSEETFDVLLLLY